MNVFKPIATGIKKLFGTEIATRTTDPNFYGALQFLPNPDPILRKMGRSQDVYDAIVMDAHVIGELRPIRAGAISYEWKLTAGGDSRVDKQALALCQSVFNRKPSECATWSDVIWTMYQAILRGFSVHEVVWQSVGDYIIPVKIIDRPQRRFVFGTDNELRLLTAQNPLLGDAVEPYKFLVCQHMATFDNPYGIALLSSCFWPYTFKHNGFRFFVKFCEKYGIPWAVGKYPQGTTPDQQNALADSLARMVEDAVAAIPDNGSVELLNVASGSQMPQERLIDVCNKEMSKALTSQTLGTEIQGTGSYAAAQTHRNREQDVNASDRKMVEDTMNTLLAWITDINIANAKPPKFEFYEESEARQEWVDTLDKARKFMSVPASFAYKITQIPMPVGNEPILIGNEPPTAPVAQFSQADGEDDPLHAKAYTQQLAERNSSAINTMLAQINAYSYQAADLHELRDILLGSYSDLDSRHLMSVMEIGYACANLAGRFDVKQEVEDDTG